MKGKFKRTDIQAIIAHAGTDTDKAREMTAKIIADIAQALTNGRTVEFCGLGTFEPRERKACTMRNPRSLAPVQVLARRVIFSGLPEA